jgi:hypothetical protein
MSKKLVLKIFLADSYRILEIAIAAAAVAAEHRPGRSRARVADTTRISFTDLLCLFPLNVSDLILVPKIFRSRFCVLTLYWWGLGFLVVT